MLQFRWGSLCGVYPDCFCLLSSPSGSQFGGITDKFIILLLGIFDKNCIFVQNMPCNIDFVVYTIL